MVVLSLEVLRRMKRLCRPTLVNPFVDQAPENRVGDKAYGIDNWIHGWTKNAELRSSRPTKSNREKPDTQTVAKLRCCRRPLTPKARVRLAPKLPPMVVRYEYPIGSFLDFVQLASMLILSQDRDVLTSRTIRPPRPTLTTSSLSKRAT